MLFAIGTKNELHLDKQDIENNIDHLIPDFQIKICIIGPQQSGRTALVDRFVHDLFIDLNPESLYASFYGSNHKTRSILMNNGQVAKIEIRDQEQIPILRQGEINHSFYKDIDIVFVICDLSDDLGLIKAEPWLESLKKSVLNAKPSVLVATKADVKEDKIAEAELVCLVKKYRLEGLAITSAKENNNVNKVFDYAANLHYLKSTGCISNKLETVLHQEYEQDYLPKDEIVTLVGTDISAKSSLLAEQPLEPVANRAQIKEKLISKLDSQTNRLKRELHETGFLSPNYGIKYGKITQLKKIKAALQDPHNDDQPLVQIINNHRGGWFNVLEWGVFSRRTSKLLNEMVTEAEQIQIAAQQPVLKNL